MSKRELKDILQPVDEIDETSKDSKLSKEEHDKFNIELIHLKYNWKEKYEDLYKSGAIGYFKKRDYKYKAKCIYYKKLKIYWDNCGNNMDSFLIHDEIYNRINELKNELLNLSVTDISKLNK